MNFNSGTEDTKVDIFKFQVVHNTFVTIINVV